MGVGQVLGYIIADSAQSVDTNATTKIRSGRARVREGSFLVFQAEEEFGHFAISSDSDLAWDSERR